VRRVVLWLDRAVDAGTRSFQIAACLGRGGFGEVYRARMTRDGGLAAEVALKVLRRDIDPDGQAVQRLRDEGRLLARLNHPAILKVHDLLVLDGRIALVTEYVDGQDLTECLQGAASIGPRALLQVVARVAGALDAAWTSVPTGEDQPLRMVHRDIKPSNIRISRHGDVKLLDFGIARTDALEREARTRTDMMVGSPAYMAPERFLEKSIRLESDVFSLGAVLYEGLSGERFYGDLPVPMQVGLAFDAARFADWTERRLALVELRPDLQALLRRTFAWDPGDRPTPGEVSHALDALADVISGPTLDRWCRARVWVAGSGPSGELDGRFLVEGTLEKVRPVGPIAGLPAPVETPDAADEPRRRSWWGWLVVGVGSVGGLGAVAGIASLVAASVAAIGLYPYVLPEAVVVPQPVTPTPEPRVDPDPDPDPEPDPEPEPVQAPGPAPEVSPAPRPRPGPLAAPVPVPCRSRPPLRFPKPARPRRPAASRWKGTWSRWWSGQEATSSCRRTCRPGPGHCGPATTAGMPWTPGISRCAPGRW
jgi:hypothetical protein